MEVSFDVLKEHLIDFSLHNIKNSSEIQRIVKIQRFLTPMIFLLFTLMIGVYRDDIATWMGIFVVLYVAWVVVYPKWYMISVRKSVKKNIEQLNGTQELIGHCKLIITDDYLVEESNVRTNNTKWRDLVRLVETPEYVFVFNTENSAYVIPKEKFESKTYERQYIDELSLKSGKKVEQWV